MRVACALPSPGRRFSSAAYVRARVTGTLSRSFHRPRKASNDHDHLSCSCILRSLSQRLKTRSVLTLRRRDSVVFASIGSSLRNKGDDRWKDVQLS
ncbi:hypothetical protein R1flu_012292 [Riccia fluitans]|uniref:Uncharacterized protein n=1 Tax=Riccia fluitans TaxID=41844 RepID=A0ABD1ZB54_9MARC